MNNMNNVNNNNTKETMKYRVIMEHGMLVDSNENELKEFSNVSRFEIYDIENEDYLVSEFVNLTKYEILRSEDLNNRGWNFTNGYRGIEFKDYTNALIHLYREIDEEIGLQIEFNINKHLNK